VLVPSPNVLIAELKLIPIVMVPEVVIGLPVIVMPLLPEAATDVTVPVLDVLLFAKSYAALTAAGVAANVFDVLLVAELSCTIPAILVVLACIVVQDPS